MFSIAFADVCRALLLLLLLKGSCGYICYYQDHAISDATTWAMWLQLLLTGTFGNSYYLGNMVTVTTTMTMLPNLSHRVTVTTT
jgi:hypothetical protein